MKRTAFALTLALAAASAPALAQVSITSTPNNGAYYVAGEAITTRITIPPLVAGNPLNARMRLNIGGTERMAASTDGFISNRRSINFSYTVTAADLDTDGISIPANSISGSAWRTRVGGTVFFINRNHGALLNQSAHKVIGSPAYISANPAPLTDANLNGATLTVTLPTGVTFSSGVSASSFVLVTSPALTGLSIGSVTGGTAGSTTAILTLATDAGYVFDVSATIAVRVLAAANSAGVDRHSPTLVFSPTVVNLPPRAVGSFADLDLDVGESAELRLAGAFADQGPLSYRVESSAPSVASVRVSGNAVLRVEALSKGLATMTVTATDRGGLSAQLSFRARVGRVLSFAAPSASAPEGGVVRLPLALSRPASAAMSVPWVARPDGDPDTADADAADLGAMSGTAAFAPGGTEAFIEVAVRDDGDIEPAREFLAVALAAPPEGADWALGLAEATLAVEEGVCDRSPAVREALRGPRDCWAPTSSELAERGYLGLHRKGVAALRSKDLLGLSGLRVLHLHRNRLAELPAGLLDGLGALERLRLDGNRIESLPEGLFAGVASLSELNLTDNPGAPFPLVMRLVRTDAKPWAPGPARVQAQVAEGTPIPLSAALLAEGAELSATQASVPAGAAAGPSVQAAPAGPGAARLSLAGDPAVPEGVCGDVQDGQYPCFRGLVPQAGPPLLLFKPPPRPTGQPPAPALSANGDRASLALDGLIAPAEAGGRLAYEARSDRPDLLAVRIANGQLVLDANEDSLEGTAVVTVTATDPDGPSASITLTVTVEFAPAGTPNWRLEWVRNLQETAQ